MAKRSLLFITVLLAFSGCREKTELEKSYAFSEKAGWQSLKEVMKQNWDSSYVPDYTKVIAMADSAIKHSPDDFRFYGLKADYYERIENYQEVLDTYLQLIRRDTSRAWYFHKIGAMYDTLGVRDSALYFYRKALAGYRREVAAPGVDSIGGYYNPRGRQEDAETLECYLKNIEEDK